MQCPAKIIEIITRPDKQYLKIQYKSDKKLQEGQAILYNENHPTTFILIDITSVGSIGIKAVTTATLHDINKLIQSPYMIKQDSLWQIH